MGTEGYPPDTGSLAQLSTEDKKKRLDAMVKIWQSDTEKRCQLEDLAAFIAATGLDEYRYSVSLRFPEWERSAVVGQVLTLRRTPQEQEHPVLFSQWRYEPLLKQMPDWKQRLPNETVFNISVRITPGGLGEGSKWAIVMPRDMVPRYKPGWPRQQDWVAWTQRFDWLAVSTHFVHGLLNAL
ncbi:hypothetical protein [Dictyobacter formicarum]|uniref:Uncharacterized protein n=1 Tax=Dictyobacter formicarum TaxID=2778368 RepID=A0ABQ3VAP3_9CHLR|nr:hypothetical protein [Dictyobacter formicarum]GHO82860.1 hypothetical protein KSZ_08660 [Dictyobacter formicarum]